MGFFDEDYQDRMHKAMTELGIPSSNHDNDPPTEISFVVRVDMLVDYCEKLRDALKKVTDSLESTLNCDSVDHDEVWDRLEKAQALVAQSEERPKAVTKKGDLKV